MISITKPRSPKSPLPAKIRFWILSMHVRICVYAYSQRKSVWYINYDISTSYMHTYVKGRFISYIRFINSAMYLRNYKCVYTYLPTYTNVPM